MPSPTLVARLSARLHLSGIEGFIGVATESLTLKPRIGKNVLDLTYCIFACWTCVRGTRHSKTQTERLISLCLCEQCLGLGDCACACVLSSCLLMQTKKEHLKYKGARWSKKTCAPHSLHPNKKKKPVNFPKPTGDPPKWPLASVFPWLGATV